MTIETVRLDPATISEIFSRPDITQADALIAIYKLIYPDFDEIDKIGNAEQSWPQCNKFTWGAIFDKFAVLDREANRRRPWGQLDVMEGGLWFNSGLSTTDPNCQELADWEVRPCGVTYKSPIMES